MQRSPQMYLLKILEMTEYLLRRAEGRSSEEYFEDQDFQFAVERAFITMGEAMNLLKKHYPEISASLEGRAAAIGFRNFLVHQYWDIDNREVWSTLTTNVRPLKSAVEALLLSLPNADQ